jgi:hypothetical protein
MDPFTLALLGSTAVSGIGSLLGGIFGSNSADKAAQQQQQANQQAMQMTQPYREAGQNALGALGNAYGQNGAAGNQAAIAAFQNSPLYQMTYAPAMQAGQQGIERNASAAGLLDSGRTLKALQDRAARIGQQTFGDYVGGLDAQATRGQNAAVGAGTQLQQGTSAYNQDQMAGSDALQAGIMGVGNSLQNGLSNYSYNNFLSSYGKH